VGSAEIHGITREEIEERGEEPKEVVRDFLLYAKGAVLVGFYVKFDAQLVERLSLKFFKYPLLNYKLDVFNLYRDAYMGARSLEEMAAEMGLSVKGRHSAIDDAYVTALVFLKLIKGYKGEKLKHLPLFL